MGLSVDYAFVDGFDKVGGCWALRRGCGARQGGLHGHRRDADSTGGDDISYGFELWLAGLGLAHG